MKPSIEGFFNRYTMNNMLDFYQKNLECIKVIKPNIAKIENIIKEGIITEFDAVKAFKVINPRDGAQSIKI